MTRSLLARGLADRPVALLLLQRTWSVLAGLVTVLLVARWLSPTEQGYYFTFASLLALQVFFELGLNVVVVHLVARDGARLPAQAPDAGLDAAPEPTLARLRSLHDFLQRWYRGAALLFLLAVSVIGAAFFAAQAELPVRLWLPVWLLMVAATALNLYWSPFLAFAEGLGQVGQVAGLRLLQSLSGHGLMWIGLALGLGLWAMPALALAGAALNVLWGCGRHSIRQRLRALAPASAHGLDWRHDILPMQWRIALSWIGGYLVFQSLTPLVFLQQGAQQAGRLGLGLAIFSAVLGLSMSWVNAVAPRFARAVALGRRRELNRLFRATVGRALAATVVVCATVVLVALALAWLAHPLAQRLPGPGALLLLALATVANCLIASMAAYMRAHVEEPMLLPSLVGGALTVLAAAICSGISLEATVLAYAALTVLVGLPWAGKLFLPYYRRTDGAATAPTPA